MLKNEFLPLEGARVEKCERKRKVGFTLQAARFQLLRNGQILIIVGGGYSPSFAGI